MGPSNVLALVKGVAPLASLHGALHTCHQGHVGNGGHVVMVPDTDSHLGSQASYT